MAHNEAIVGKIGNIQPIEGADKIVKAEVIVNNIPIAPIVVGVESKEGDNIVYFDSNMVLSEAVLKDYPDLGNYLAKNGRVRVVSLKKTISNGLAVAVDKFEKYGEVPSHGNSFLTIGKTEICRKYVAPVRHITQTAKDKTKGKKGKKQSRMIEDQFRFHIDTEQLARNAYKISPNDVCSISKKMHGTSAILSNCLVTRKLSFVECFIKHFGIKIVDTEYDYIHASRTVVKNGSEDSGYYGEDLWGYAMEPFKGKLHKGETIYCEIVGFLRSGGAIQKKYDYGCDPMTHRVLVYRITQTSIDGSVVELGWKAMQDRAKEIGVECVHTYFFGRAKDLYPHIKEDDDWNKNFVNELSLNFLEQMDNECKNKVPAEGIVLRKEGLYIESYKLKSQKFFLQESKAHEEGEVDIEEEA